MQNLEIVNLLCEPFFGVFPDLSGQRSCRTKVFEFSSRSLPRILLRIFPEFLEEFSCFVSWDTETRKIHPKTRHFSMQNSQANSKKNSTKVFRRAGQVRICSGFTLGNFKFLRHIGRAILAVRLKFSHRCVSLKESPSKTCPSLQAREQNINQANVYESKGVKHIAV